MNETLPQQTVLLVDDEEAVTFILGKEFEARGHRVLRAKNGKEGLELALAEHPDVILCDLKMPVMGGLEMLQALRKDPWGKNADAIILTNVSDDMTTLQAAMHQGAFFYLVKGDAQMTEIVTKVQSRLEKHIADSSKG